MQIPHGFISSGCLMMSFYQGGQTVPPRQGIHKQSKENRRMGWLPWLIKEHTARNLRLFAAKATRTRELYVRCLNLSIISEIESVNESYRTPSRTYTLSEICKDENPRPGVFIGDSGSPAKAVDFLVIALYGNASEGRSISS